MKGYIILWRDIFNDISFFGEKFSRREAFLDLVQMASFKTCDISIRGKTIRVNAGDVVCSVRTLANRWNWSTGKVTSVLREFENEHKLTRKFEQSICLISITSYSKYFQLDGISLNTNCDNDNISSSISSTPSIQSTTSTKVDSVDDIDSVDFIDSENIIKNTRKEINNAHARKTSTNDTFSQEIERLYSLYPTKCVVSGRPTGKSYKDKTKLATILKSHTPDEIEKTIKRYIDECRNARSFMKNFSTFLNNLPDYSVEPAREVKKDDSVYVVSERRTEDGLYERKYSNGFTTITDK